MNYDIVELEEKTVAAISARTNNTSPDMGAVIGGLWERFFSPDLYPAIEHKSNEKALGIYTDYAGDEKDDYTAAVACEKEREGNMPEGTEVRKIPAGKYARFIVRGHMENAAGDFWSRLWAMELPRAFTCDFEEYQNNDMENAEIHMYIALREE